MKFITETKFVFLNQKLIYIFTERIYRIKITNFVFKNIKKILFLNSIFLNESQKIKVKSFEI